MADIRQDSESAATPVRPSSFLADLTWSARAVARTPLFVVLTLVLVVPLRLTGTAPLVDFPLQIVLAGFVGTQRVWFAHLYRGQAMRWYQIRRTTRMFIGRFIVLGLIVLLFSLPVFTLGYALSRRTTGLGAVVALFTVYGLIVDFALTFVVPALTLTTDSVRKAWRIGLQMIRQTWPRCGWYALTPGFTLVALTQSLRPASFNLAGSVAAVALAAVVALCFKGAIVFFYLRQDASNP